MHFPVTAPLVKKRLERSAELVGATPLHLLTQTALPLKSPTGAFTRQSGRSKREIKNELSAEDAQSASGGHFKSSEPGGLFATFCKKIRLQ